MMLGVMKTDFFKTVKILDGGMGQELLARGLISKGTLWSASALINEDNHSLIVDTHRSFIDAGADVIVTNNFSARKVRLEQNKVENTFEYINKKAGELAVKARDISKKNVGKFHQYLDKNEIFTIESKLSDYIRF